MLTISQLTDKYHITRQTLFIKIKDGRLKATKKKGKWCIREKDYLSYIKDRYHRYLDNGVKFFDGKNVFSPRQVSQKLKCSVQKIYYDLRRGRLPASRYRYAWVITLEDFKCYKEFLKE